MLVLIQVIAIVLGLTIHEHKATASYYSLVVPVYKHTDASTNPLYSTHAYFFKGQYPNPEISTPPYFTNNQYVQQSMLIDLDAPFTWHSSDPHQESCEACPYPVTCGEFQCTDLRTTFSYQSPSCPPPTNRSIWEEFNDCQVCPVNVISPVTGECSQVIPTYDQFMFTSSYSGTNILSTDLYVTYPTVGSTPPSTFAAFPSNVLGVMALSSSPYAVPAYLRDPVNRILAICLPRNTSNPGVLFLGNGPYYLDQTYVDAMNLLSYTMLLKHPKSFGYFIGVSEIIIKNKSIIVPANATTKISTLVPYTKLRTDIYNDVVRRFSRITKRIPPAKLVAPFDLCFNTTVNGTTVGIKVPDIDLVLQDGKTWTISTANSIKQVTEDVACLAFVDGGPTSEHAIVVGTYQLEDNLLVFNLETSTFGFSSSLLSNHTSCSNFDFSVVLNR